MSSQLDLTTDAAVERFLYLEARLLDQRRYAEWEDLWADDGRYEIPLPPDESGSAQALAIVSDDRNLIGQRVARLQTGEAHVQDPPSRAVRAVSNVLVSESDEGIRAFSSLIAAEFRRRTTLWAGEVEHSLRRVGDSYEIRRKTIRLVNAGDNIPALGFIL